jgi:YHS domain-containing protein
MIMSLRAFAVVLVVAISSLSPSLSLAQPAGDLVEGDLTEPVAEPLRNVAEHNIDKKSKLAIKGYDPVAYFSKYGGKPAYKGVRYRFVSSANRTEFLMNPARYEPAYGGWCAWAMKSGEKTRIDPKTFIVRGERLFLFYNGFLGNTKKDWEKQEHISQTVESDAEWKTLSGEEPRVFPVDTAP